ncbi:MAG: TolB family protein [Gaiellaceae bacterium]
MRKLITLMLLAAGIAALMAIPAAAKPGGTNGKIVVNVDNSVTGQEQVYAVDPNGTDMQLLANDAEAGQWSPDGTKIALTPNEGTGSYLNFDTGAFTDLGLPFDLYPDLALFCVVWSPDGSRLACEGFGQTDGNLNGVYTIRASDGGDLRRVTYHPNGDDRPADYSPNGKRLVITRLTDTSSEIDTVKLDGSGLTRITPDGTAFDFTSGSWSPQGNEILFSAHAPDFSYRSSIWAVHSDGSGLRQIPVPGCGGLRSDQTSIGCQNPVWSPDGQKIMFERHSLIPNDHFDLYTVNADGSGLFQVTNTPNLNEAGGDWGTHPVTP